MRDLGSTEWGRISKEFALTASEKSRDEFDWHLDPSVNIKHFGRNIRNARGDTHASNFSRTIRERYAEILINDVVEVDRNKASGVPVLKGTRFKIAQLIGELADGFSVARIAKQHDLEKDNIVKFLRAIAIKLDQSFLK